MTQVTPEGHQDYQPRRHPGAIAAGREAFYPATAQAADDVPCTRLGWRLHACPRPCRPTSRSTSSASYPPRPRIPGPLPRARHRARRAPCRSCPPPSCRPGAERRQRILIDLALTQQDLAEMTGTTRYTISSYAQRMGTQWHSQNGPRPRTHETPRHPPPHSRRLALTPVLPSPPSNKHNQLSRPSTPGHPLSLSTPARK